MALIRPRLNDYHNLAFTQEEADFAIPFLDDDIPLYVKPFLLWKSPSQQDQALHTTLLSSFNFFGNLSKSGREPEAEAALIRLSECQEVGLGSARNKTGKRIGSGTAREILAQFSMIPQVKERGFEHIEEIQLFVDQVSKDRISDFTCSLLKSFLIDYTIDQSNRWGIPMSEVVIHDVFDFQKKRFSSETLKLPVNPANGLPVVLVPKRWLRFSPWIAFDDYFTNGFVKDGTVPTDRVSVLMFNRAHYDAVQTYVRQKERTQADCKNDPLFRPIAIMSAKRKWEEIKKLPTGKDGNADRLYEDKICQIVGLDALSTIGFCRRTKPDRYKRPYPRFDLLQQSVDRFLERHL